MSCKRSAKLSLHIMASNSQRGLPQRLSNKRLALIIPKSNKLLQRIKSSCQNSEKSRSTKTTQKKQLRSTQSYSRDKLLLGNSQKASTFHRTTGSRHSWAFRSRARRGVRGETRAACARAHGMPREEHLDRAQVRGAAHSDVKRGGTHPCMH